MKTNRLSDTLTALLNAQVTQEAYAAQMYLSFGAWLDDQGYAGIANFLFRHVEEERSHMMKFLEYILERGAKPTIEAIPAPPADPSSVQDCFEKIFNQEVENTKSIYNIVNLSHDEKDWITWNFLQWFVKEQAEEETLAMNLLDKIKIAGGSGASPTALLEINKELAKAPDEAGLAQDVTAANP